MLKDSEPVDISDDVDFYADLNFVIHFDHNTHTENDTGDGQCFFNLSNSRPVNRQSVNREFFNIFS